MTEAQGWVLIGLLAFFILVYLYRTSSEDVQSDRAGRLVVARVIGIPIVVSILWILIWWVLGGRLWFLDF